MTVGQSGPDLEAVFRPDLQGLRAIAILLVVLQHAGVPLVPGGFIGVDVFFVLSGYLITGLLLREMERTGRISLLRFYARRLKRLLPALAVMLCSTFGAASWLLSEAEAHAQLASGPFAATWTSNLYFALRSVGYFEELPTRDLFLHTWSLGVEEQFYLVWPMLLLLLSELGARTQAACSPASGWLLPGLSAALLISFLASVYWTLSSPQLGFYLMPSRIWQFSLGALTYLGLSSPLAQSSRLTPLAYYSAAGLAILVGLALIVGAAIGLHPNIPWPGYWALIPSLGAALIIAAGHGRPEGRRGPLAHPALVWLGDRSYSLYVWHWPALALGFSLGMQGQPLASLGLTLLSLLAAILSYRFVELPFWKGRFRDASPRRVLLVSLLVMLTCIYAMLQTVDHPTEPRTTADPSTAWRTDVPMIYRMPCDAWYQHDRVEPCVFGTKSSARTVVLLGDSIGAQWFSMVPGIFTEPDWRTIVLTKSSCPMVDEDYFYERIGQVFHLCTSWRNSVLDLLEELHPDIVILGSSSTYGFDESAWVEGSARILARLSKAAGRVFVIPGTPSLGFDGPGCVTRHLAEDGTINRTVCVGKNREQQVNLVKDSLRRAAGRFGNVQILDLNDLVCTDGNCSAVSDDGVVVFRDGQHLTDSFVRSRIPMIRKRLEGFDGRSQSP